VRISAGGGQVNRFCSFICCKSPSSTMGQNKRVEDTL
jgi:hypothetical protein